jgi:outer membrane autotransporter protein
LRLAGKFELGRTRLRPYLKTDLWHEFGGSDTVAFNGFPIVTDREGTAFGFGGGLVADITSAVSLYASADYTTAVSGEDDRIFEGNLGVSIKW